MAGGSRTYTTNKVVDVTTTPVKALDANPNAVFRRLELETYRRGRHLIRIHEGDPAATESKLLIFRDEQGENGPMYKGDVWLVADPTGTTACRVIVQEAELADDSGDDDEDDDG